ncbi:MAG: hypothetical protein COT73_04810 [Bdellovibrio sp. CG10_big_fil_rev_8_21_14_0_10_47_8]|nr:MAG: hypothetical protein COT73_04810 [Bdellovibrio sp. CG10_big_fil_rev_8_21_14_0_10_47_8]
MNQFIRLFVLILLVSFRTFAQSNIQNTVLKSSVDDYLSIKSAAVAPAVDNVSGIYARPLTSQLEALVRSDRQWELNSWPTEIKNTPEEYEDNATLVKSALAKAHADVLFTSRLTKGPRGISIKVSLFSGKDGLLLAQETLQDFSGFELSEVQIQVEEMYRKLKSKIPYSGIILSRRGQQVTINIGTQAGIRDGQEISVIQVIKITRHPRFKFIVSAEKEIIGRLKVDKVDESLSFASIILERTENVVQPGMKLMPVEFVAYPDTPKTADGKLAGGLTDRPDNQVSLGNNAREWVPENTPTFGKLGVLLGIGTYTINNTLNSVGSVNASSTFTPSIHVDGELWLTTRWFMGIGLKQYVLSLDNAYPGSSPSKVSVSSMLTSVQGGYNFLLEDNFFGPKLQGLLGYSKFSSTVDTSSPTAYTSLDFGGLCFGIAGSFPVSDVTPIDIGAKLMYYLNASVGESPVASGSSSSAKITTFSAFGVYRWKEHTNIRGEVMYDLYSASFSGTGSRANSASSASHTLTTVAGGIEYLF